ncbi:MAG: enoyl-CoA hydratase/isomerase family protein [Syntrophomonadaceae bacterium]|nr:enoyl-CoA hydratase/isomerase family protein [Syntrophomonadaceae bacterium]
MSFQNVKWEKTDRIATVFVDRPKALNALNKDTLVELKSAFIEVGEDNDVDVVILTGSGDKAFVAGADIAYMQNLSASEARAFSRLGQEVFLFIENCAKPTIAAVNGFCLGGGCELAMSCDFRIASSKAVFGQPEVGLGILPGFGGTQRLSRFVGPGMAKQLIYSAANIKAEEALRIGLVNAIAEPDALIETVKNIAGQICRQGQFAVRLAKHAINAGFETDINRAMFYESDSFGLCYTSPEQKEGMTAFLEKRPPQYKK